MILAKERWLDGKRFVYSTTYDEGFVDLLEHTLPIHRKFGFPGQLAMVAGQLGAPRAVQDSSWNGKLHLGASQIGEFLSEGWGVSSHSLTHGASRSMYADPYAEVVRSREILEDALAIPITSFIVPYDNDNHPPVVNLARQHGYLSVFTLTDDVNGHDSDLYALNRSPLVEEGFYPFYTRLDHYQRLHQARECQGWVVDYTHLTNPEVVAPTKEITQASLIRRLEKVIEVSGGDVWAANCDEVVDYILVHKATTLNAVTQSSDGGCWRVALDLPPRVTRRILTFACELPEAAPARVSLSTGTPLRQSQQGRLLRVTAELNDGMEIAIRM